jgi:branched-chain amino acid transport system ATP-binding protein
VAELLTARGVTLTFGGVAALSALDLTVEPKQIAGLIGPNGAGKTSLLNCISRFYNPQQGDIRFEGRDLLKARPYQLAGMGIARTFQHLELFTSMNVLENVMVGAHSGARQSGIGGGLGRPWRGRSDSRQSRTAREMLESVGLSSRMHSRVTALPLGQQKRLSIARALACRPRLLLLDEPASGMNEIEKQELCALLLRLRDELGLTILLIEHDMDLVMNLCEHLTVLDFGSTIASGTPLQVRNDPAVIAAYLGADEQAAEALAPPDSLPARPGQEGTE